MKKLLCVLAALLVAVVPLCGVSAETSDGTCEIGDEAQLLSFLSGESFDRYDTFVLCNDITLTVPTEKCAFSGTLDGRGFSILLENGGAGLFSELTRDSLVRNLSIKGTVGGKDGERASGICDVNRGKIENCIVTATFSSDGEIGGICAENAGKIINCAVLGNPSEDATDRWHPIAALNTGETENCYFIEGYAKGAVACGVALDDERCRSEELVGLLNAYAGGRPELVEWSGGNGTYPRFSTASGGTASVFAEDQVVLAVCGSVFFIVLLLLIILYTDKRLKRTKTER